MEMKANPPWRAWEGSKVQGAKGYAPNEPPSCCDTTCTRNRPAWAMQTFFCRFGSMVADWWL